MFIRMHQVVTSRNLLYLLILRDWENDITVISSFAYMRTNGSMWSNLWRNGAIIGQISRVDYYGKYYQSFETKQEISIKRGDRIMTHCAYDTSYTANLTPFGQHAGGERCLEYLM